MFSILIPTFNNLEYLKICIESLKKNSKFDHQIIVHVNQGTDGTIEYLKDKNIEYTYTKENIGMPKALNLTSKKANFNYILISHDDFYYCPGWDVEFKNELNLLNHNKFYFSATMVGAGQVQFNAGQTAQSFDETKLINNLETIKTFDFQGTTKCPGLVHIDVWKNLGGWSEEFSPTGGDDTDFAMKLWKYDVRIFKGLGKSLAYHFGSITTRKKDKSLFTYLGSKGNKIFLKKWGITINFFEKYYLRSGLDNEKKLILNKYDGPLKKPFKNFNFYKDLIKVKIMFVYIILINFKYR